MKAFQGRASSAKRPYFSARQIEDICGNALQRVGLLPAQPSPVRIERFVEKQFGVSPRYESLPDGVLGFTQFSDSGVNAIIVSKDFEGADVSQSAERRYRTTLAHEAGHGLMHASLFSLGQKAASLFGTTDEEPEIMCRDVEGIATRSGYDGRWWEFQANKAIGALLLPRHLVHAAIQTLAEPRGMLGDLHLPASKREVAAQDLASVFDVNPAVARIRIADIFGDPENPPVDSVARVDNVRTVSLHWTQVE